MLDLPLIHHKGRIGIPAYAVRSHISKAKSWPNPTDKRTFIDPGHGLCFQAEYLGRMYNRTKRPEIKAQISAVLRTLLQAKKEPSMKYHVHFEASASVGVTFEIEASSAEEAERIAAAKFDPQKIVDDLLDINERTLAGYGQSVTNVAVSVDDGGFEVVDAYQN